MKPPAQLGRRTTVTAIAGTSVSELTLLDWKRCVFVL
jgi:hypothetical protein